MYHPCSFIAHQRSVSALYKFGAGDTKGDEVWPLTLRKLLVAVVRLDRATREQIIMVPQSPSVTTGTVSYGLEEEKRTDPAGKGWESGRLPPVWGVSEGG